MVQVKEEPQGPEAVMGVRQRGGGTQSSCSSKGWAAVTDEGGQGRRGGGVQEGGPPRTPLSSSFQEASGLLRFALRAPCFEGSRLGAWIRQAARPQVLTSR